MRTAPQFEPRAILALLLLTAFVGCGVADLSEVEDSDLQTSPIRLAMRHNALTPLGRGIDHLAYPSDFEEATDRIELTLLGWEWDDEWVADLVDRNEGALWFFARLPIMPRFKVHVDSTFMEATTLARWLMLSRVRALEIRMHALEGDPVRALDELIELAHFGVRVRGVEGGRVVYHLMGTSLIRVALTTFKRVLIDAPLSRERAAELIAGLEELRVDRDAWSGVLSGEYQWRKAILEESIAAREEAPGSEVSRDPFAREVIDSLVSLLPHGYTLQRNRTLERLAGHFRNHREFAGRPCLASDPHRAPAARLTGGVPDPMTFERNALGRYWADFTGLTIAVHHDTMCVSESFLSAVITMVALRAYQTENGEMPETLGALVPDYIGAVPIDYFGADPLRYSKDKHRLYSVGSDFEDAGGVWKPDERCTAELAWPIPFAAAGYPARPPERITCAAPRS